MDHLPPAQPGEQRYRVTNTTGALVARFTLTPQGEVVCDDPATVEAITSMITRHGWDPGQAATVFGAGWSNVYLSVGPDTGPDPGELPG